MLDYMVVKMKKILKRWHRKTSSSVREAYVSLTRPTRKSSSEADFKDLSHGLRILKRLG